MNAGTVATWAAQNGFKSLDAWIYRRHDDNRRLTLEIKRMSVVLIEERNGARPRVTSRLFKDMRFNGESGKLEGLLAAG
jgi:hypothetical protein